LPFAPVGEAVGDWGGGGGDHDEREPWLSRLPGQREGRAIHPGQQKPHTHTLTAHRVLQG